MNDRIPTPQDSLKRSSFPTVILFVLAVLFLLLAYAANNNFFGIFDSAEETTNTHHLPEATLPDMAPAEQDGGYAYYTATPETALRDAREQPAYRRVVRITTAYEDDYTSETFTISRSGARYRVEGDSLLLICDGETVALRYGTHSSRLTPPASLFYEEIGLTSLDQLRAMVADTDRYETTLTTSEDRRTLYASVLDFTASLRMEFTISLESGLIRSERFYYNDMAYRTVLTESVALAAEANLTDALFTLPSETGQS